MPRNEDAPGEDYKPCSLVSCSTAECSGYDPIGGVGLTRGLRESRAVIHRGLLDHSVLFDEPHLTIEVERWRATSSAWHTIRVSVEDCSIDLDADGRPDAVRCSDP